MTMIMLLRLNDAVYLRNDVGAVIMIQRHVVEGLIYMPTFLGGGDNFPVGYFGQSIQMQLDTFAAFD